MKRFFLILSIVGLAALTACAAGADGADEAPGVPLYFLAPTDSVKGRDALVCSYEPMELSLLAPLEEQVEAVARRLLSGSEDGTLRSPFPDDTVIRSVKVRDRRAYVDLSGSFSHLDGVALTLADYCLTLSLSAIDGIESVTITANGRMLAQQPRQVFRERDVVLSTKDSVMQLVEVSLYFADEMGTLTAERRTLEIYEGETQSGNLIAALLEGPRAEELFEVIPERFVISSIKVENGVCRINLPAASLRTLPAEEDAQWMILHSLTDSLYSLDTIREIRISEEGTELQKFGLIDLATVAKRPRS